MRHACFLLIAFLAIGCGKNASQPAAPQVSTDDEDDGAQSVNLQPKDLDSDWSALAGDDAAKAYPAIMSLAASPKRSVPFLQKHLKPAVPPDAKRIAKLITDLDQKQFTIREKAAGELKKIGESAGPALRKAIKGNPSLELRRRAEAILEEIDRQVLPPERLRILRAIEALEMIGTDEAKAVLKRLAKGAAEDRLTEEAKATLERLSKRPAAKP